MTAIRDGFSALSAQARLAVFDMRPSVLRRLVRSRRCKDKCAPNRPTLSSSTSSLWLNLSPQILLRVRRNPPTQGCLYPTACRAGSPPHSLRLP